MATRSIPLAFVGLITVAMIFLGAGALGLLAPELAPPLARPALAWSLIAVGAMLDVGAIMVLLSARVSPGRQR